MDTGVTKETQASNEIELYLNVEANPDQVQKFKDDLIQEQHNSFMGMQTEIDECEKLVGIWSPFNKITTLYDTIDEVHDAIEEFEVNNAEETKSAPTPKS